ncbi:ATP-binding protein [Pseudomonas sp. GM17]|uniref:ATP-binding protein n=1 Tax=Pseudomonas sp. GM17 TaxID=1144323 RepID=UPI00027231B8|nr:ATP-binding protein [Pseudomonas sp. GM17]WIE52927.1 ATP-binding protein [Pseudomonas sp. GM17]
MKRGAAFWPAILLVWLPSVFSHPLDLTPEERAWIAANPVVHVAVEPNWKPIQYVEDGQLMGLATEYIDFIEHSTGLRFEPVPDSGLGRRRIEKFQRGEVDVLPGIMPMFAQQSIIDAALFTNTYYTGATIVVTRKNSQAVFDLHRLDGHIVAVKKGSSYESAIRALYPAVKILGTKTSEDSLTAVIDKQADAALDVAPVLLPFLRSKYDEELYVSGGIARLPMELSMAVRRDLPVLRDIIDKVLASLTAEQIDAMVQNELESANNYGRPSLDVLLRYYGLQMALVLTGLLLIAGFAVHARQQRRLAMRSEKEKTMFLAVLSHEIRSPMNAILASMELLMQRPELPEESLRLLAVASSGAENLLYLLDDVLDISKLEAGRLQLDLGPVDIMELTRSVVDLLALKAKNGVELELIQEHPIEPHLMLDRFRVEQVLHNLISNAIKFTPEGGVTISIRLDPSPPPLNRHQLQIRIVDTGIGIDADSLQRLFQPYTQANTNTARKFGGTGLGLTICRQLLELMGGSIDLESEPGRGSIASVRLPCDIYVPPLHLQEQGLSRQQLGVPATERVLRVLLVEDMPANQAVLHAQLEVLGCSPTLAPDGEKALFALEQNTFDIVLLDCDLPSISGYEVARQWRAIESSLALAPTPIMAISASTDDEHTTTCFEAGMDGVLKKPIKLGKLRDALQLWTDLSLAHIDDEAAFVTDERTAFAHLWSDVHALRAAVEMADMEDATHYAHRLFGAFAILKQPDMASLAKSMEARLKVGSFSSVQTDLLTLEQLLGQCASSTGSDRISP